MTMKRSGSADLPLHYGYVPQWLAERMAKLGLAVTEVLLSEYGKAEVIRRLSDPFWFQSFGAAMGMDWHSSGITTSGLGALKRGLAPLAAEPCVPVSRGPRRDSRRAPLGGPGASAWASSACLAPPPYSCSDRHAA